MQLEVNEMNSRVKMNALMKMNTGMKANIGMEMNTGMKQYKICRFENTIQSMQDPSA